jgi:hypothetical protein
LLRRFLVHNHGLRRDHRLNIVDVDPNGAVAAMMTVAGAGPDGNRGMFTAPAIVMMGDRKMIQPAPAAGDCRQRKQAAFEGLTHVYS